jgi:hypothetical protein
MAEESEEYVFQDIDGADKEEKSKVEEVEQKVSREMEMVEVEIINKLGGLNKVNLVLIIGEIILLTYGLFVLLDLAPLF